MSVFITGASSGIGEACARTLAAAGYDLILAARREERLRQLSQELIDQHGISVHFFSLDVRDRKTLQLEIQKHPQVFQKIDIVINNAGLAKSLAPLQEGLPEDWDTVIDTNIKGLLYTTGLLLPEMIARGQGHIVNIGSVAGHWVYPKGAVYCASKFAVRALNEGLRMDLNGTGIRVTSISPGMVQTDFSEVRLGSKALGDAVYARRNPLLPKDISETVLWCIQRPAHVNIQEIILYPTEQASVTLFK